MTHLQNILQTYKDEAQQRVLSKCVQDGECLRFPYGHNTSGYGQISIKRKTYRTHRLIYQLHHGVVLAEDQYVLHKCDVRDCCNINHLFLGSAADNMRDKMSKGRHRVACGKNHGHTHLNDELVTQMILEFRAGASCRSLSHKYGVSVSNVYEIAKYRHTWTHLTI